MDPSTASVVCLRSGCALWCSRGLGQPEADAGGILNRLWWTTKHHWEGKLEEFFFLSHFFPNKTWISKCHKAMGVNLSCETTSTKTGSGSLKGNSGCGSRGMGYIAGLVPHCCFRGRVETMDINQIQSFSRALLLSPKPKLLYTGMFTEQLC